MLRTIKLRFLAIGMAALLVSLLSQPALAYYTTLGIATNVVTSGNITMQIHEMTDQGTEFPKEGVYVIPGDIVSKVVTVENICEHPFYLRVKLLYGTDSEELTVEDCLKLNINEESWKLHDGWYYYTAVLQPGEESPHIFSHVEIVGNKVNTSHIGKTLQLTVLAQAVQSENNPIQNGDTTTAQGWPAE
jgi:hypothetical protein